MFNAPSSLWIDPRVIVRLFANTIKQTVSDVGEFETFVKNRKNRSLVEGWRASMYLIALSRLIGIGRFYTQKNASDPPDFFGLHVYERESCVVAREIEIEVFQVAQQSNSIQEEFAKKIEKNYSQNTVLVGHLCKQGVHSLNQL